MHTPDPIWVFVEKLESLNLPYMVTGSIAAIFYGEPRLTHDIDLVVHLRTEDVPRLEQAFSIAEYYCPPEEVIRIEMARRPYGHFNLIHHQTGFKADIYTEGEDPLHRWALERRQRVSLSESQSLWLAPAEYLIIRKLEFYRAGGSDKHLSDIRGMLPQLKNKLDLEFLNAELTKRSLSDIWRPLAQTL